jgi:drug/metabolite transporter (DMT)-like permease
MRWIDALLVLVVVIWGSNYSVVKRAFDEMPPQAFNALRMALASLMFLGAMAAARRLAARGRAVSPTWFTHAPVTRGESFRLLQIGLVGQLGYPYFWASGVAQTSVANAALIMGAVPIVVGLISLERLGPLYWAGVALSAAGIAAVVGPGASFGSATFRGDLLVMASVVCWSIYTVWSAPLMARHSPLFVTGVTMSVGAVLYLLVALPQLLVTDWRSISAWTWSALVLSALLALCVSYLIRYLAVQQIGPSRTAIYSNVVPLIAIVVAAVWLHEPITILTVLGAAAVLAGVLLTRR